MAKCPVCGSFGALILFSEVECPSPKCANFVGDITKICQCCGQIGHVPTEESLAKREADQIPLEDSPDTPASGEPHDSIEEQSFNHC